MRELKPLTEGQKTESAGVENEEIIDLLNRLGGIANSLNALAYTGKKNAKQLLQWQATIHEAIKVIEDEWL